MLAVRLGTIKDTQTMRQRKAPKRGAPRHKEEPGAAGECFSGDL